MTDDPRWTSSSKASPDPSRGVVQVATCLDLPELASAVVLAGEGRLDTPVDWVAVIEWPVEGFVTPGDFVLTTGIGCTDEMLERLVDEAAEAGAAAICLSVGPGAPVASVPDYVLSAANVHGVVLATIPWEVRFSDVSRAVIETLYAPHRGGGATRAAGDLPFEFTRALLESGGVVSVAHALEGVIDGGVPVVVLDPTLSIIGAGPTASDWVARGTLQAAVRALEDSVIADGPADVAGVIHAVTNGLLVVAAPARGQGKILGWVMLVLPAGREVPTADVAVRHAATAAAIELLRHEAAEELGSRAKAEFFWRLSAGEFDSPQELAARSALLGLPLNARFRVVAGLAESDDERSGSSSRAAREIAQRVRMRLRHPASVATHRESEILLCLEQRDTEVDSLLDDPALQAFSSRASWGVANGLHGLSQLQDAVAQARTALAVTRAVRGPGRKATADQLGSFMLLHALGTDRVATGLAHEVIRVLEEADNNRKSDLLGTLAVYLDANGNISSAARRLHLNRHSLIYRLRRIEELTNRSLDSHEDRLMLDISMRVRQLRSVEPN